MSTLAPQWKALGLESQYRAQELIVLQVPQSDSFPADAKIRLEGPAPSSELVTLSPRREGVQMPFFEFYALRPGDYQLNASWFQGEAQIHIHPFENIGFATEFGIFFGVVGVLLIWMLRRYIMGRKDA